MDMRDDENTSTASPSMVVRSANDQQDWEMSQAAKCMILPGAQASADRRSKTRRILRDLKNHVMREVADLENSLVEDEPEGMVVVELKISKTLAEQLVDALECAGARI
jgi:hypothetical protein